MHHANFEKSEKRKLLEIVTVLANHLERPVSSKDLARHLKAFPQLRPSLTQRLGQQLIKASRLSKVPTPHLYPVGKFHCLVYYAPDARPHWKVLFDQFTRSETLRLFYQEHYPDRIRYLWGGPHELLARHVLAGWLMEANLLLTEIKDEPIRSLLLDEMEQVRPMANPTFTPRIPTQDLISRVEAIALYQREIELRCPYRNGFKINLYRYLSPLVWPQSTLYPKPPFLCHYRPQLEADIRSRWPLMDENAEEASGLKITLKYPYRL